MAMTRKAALQFLGLLPGSTEEEIKKSYRKLAMVHHPDRGGNEAEFKKLQEAYELLTKPVEKEQPFIWPGRTSGGESFEDILNRLRQFEDMYEYNTATAKVRTYESTIQVTLKEAFEGCKKTASFNIIGPTQFIIDVPKGLVPGSKLRIISAQDSSGREIIIQTILDIKVGDEKVTWAKEPNIYSGGVEGSGDIEIPTKINWLDIMLGRNITYETIDGATLQLRVLPGIEAGNRIRIQGRGYWKDSHQNQRGDVYLRVIPVVPKLADVAVADLAALNEARKNFGTDV